MLQLLKIANLCRIKDIVQTLKNVAHSVKEKADLLGSLCLQLEYERRRSCSTYYTVVREEAASIDNIADDDKNDDSNGQYWANDEKSKDYDDDYDD